MIPAHLQSARRLLRLLLVARGAPSDAASLHLLSGYETVPIVRAWIILEGQSRELTFAASETDVSAAWLADVAAGRRAFTSSLPAPEFSRDPWCRANYRWTTEAHELTRRLEVA